MELSCSKEYPGYDEVKAMNHIVLLNGDKLSYCVYANEEKGVAIVMDTDKDGRLKSENGHFLTKEIEGNIKIVKAPVIVNEI